MDKHLRGALAEVYEGALALKIGRFNRTTNTGAACKRKGQGARNDRKPNIAALVRWTEYCCTSTQDYAHRQKSPIRSREDRPMDQCAVLPWDNTEGSLAEQ